MSSLDRQLEKQEIENRKANAIAAADPVFQGKSKVEMKISEILMALTAAFIGSFATVCVMLPNGLTFGGDADSQIITDSLDDLPLSEMQSFVVPVPEAYDQTRTVIKACNTCYKFLKEYLNWKVT